MRARSVRSMLVAVLVVIAPAACSSSVAPTASAGPSVAGTAIAVSGAWARPGMASGTGAADMVITNGAGQADRLVGASCAAAASVELHETSTDASGMTGMHPLDGIDLPSGGRVTLEPGGMHLMLIGLTKPLEPGQAIEITLVFQHAGSVVVRAEVREG